VSPSTVRSEFNESKHFPRRGATERINKKGHPFVYWRRRSSVPQDRAVPGRRIENSPEEERKKKKRRKKRKKRTTRMAHDASVKGLCVSAVERNPRAKMKRLGGVTVATPSQRTHWTDPSSSIPAIEIQATGSRLRHERSARRIGEAIAVASFPRPRPGTPFGFYRTECVTAALTFIFSFIEEKRQLISQELKCWKFHFKFNYFTDFYYKNGSLIGLYIW